MQKEKIVLSVLVLIIVIGLSGIILIQPNADGSGTIFDDIVKMIFGEEEEKGAVIAIGDCVDVNYIGYIDDTIFDTSYADVENKTFGDPLKVFVSLNKSESPPDEYINEYSSAIIDGLMEGLIGLEEGETATIGPIPPEKAYGLDLMLSVGDTFKTITVAPDMNITVEATAISEESFSLKWIDIENLGYFTMPMAIMLENLEYAYYSLYELPPLPPYYFWENSSEVINITDDSFIVKTTPNKSENLIEEFGQQSIYQVGTKIGTLFPDATFATWDETTITLTSSPEIGANYSIETNEDELILTISNITDDHINISFQNMGQTDYFLANRTISFNRTYSLRRVFNNIPILLGQAVFGEDLSRAGYSLNRYAGKTLLFEVRIENIYKTSLE